METISVDQQVVSKCSILSKPLESSYKFPQLSIYKYTSECKKMTRILRDIAHDIMRAHNQDNYSQGATYQGPIYKGPKPSTWLLRCVVQSHLCSNPDTEWQINIHWTLDNIIQNSAPSSPAHHRFLQLDGITPLFPNSQNFTLQHIHAFAKAAQNYLAAQHTLLQ